MLSPEWPDKAVTTVNLTNKASTDMTSMMQESMVCTQCCDAWYQPELMQVSFSWGIPIFLLALQKSRADCEKHHTIVFMSLSHFAWIYFAWIDGDSCRWRQLVNRTEKRKKGIESTTGRFSDFSDFGWVIHATSSPAERLITILVCVDLLCSKRDYVLKVSKTRWG